MRQSYGESIAIRESHFLTSRPSMSQLEPPPSDWVACCAAEAAAARTYPTIHLPRFWGEISRPIKLLQHLLDLGVLLFDRHQRLLDLLQAFLLIGLVRRAGLVLLLSEVLDLLAAVLDFCEAQRR
jgi:hypothetical protein